MKNYLFTDLFDVYNISAMAGIKPKKVRQYLAGVPLVAQDKQKLVETLSRQTEVLYNYYISNAKTTKEIELAEEQHKARKVMIQRMLLDSNSIEINKSNFKSILKNF